jgi:hypothetical protein
MPSFLNLQNQNQIRRLKYKHLKANELSLTPYFLHTFLETSLCKILQHKKDLNG